MGKRATAVTAWESLFRAQVAVMRSLQAEFPSKHLSFNEYDVLFNVSRQPDREIALRDLNQTVLLTQPSVSRLVDRLVARGLVSKCPEPGDARANRIRMTEQGYTLFRSVALEHMASIEDRVGGVLEADELSRLTELCDKLRGEGTGDGAEH
jgi:DNA-binding MarR family transcriptional regulator